MLIGRGTNGMVGRAKDDANVESVQPEHSPLRLSSEVSEMGLR
jgi:hypothetical protein